MTCLFNFFQYYSTLFYGLIQYYGTENRLYDLQIEIYNKSYEYSNIIIHYFLLYLDLVQEFYLENKYLCIGFFVNYTFLYFLYYTHLYYINNIPNDIEEKLKYNKELVSRNSYLENMIRNVNSICSNLSYENSKFEEEVKSLCQNNKTLSKEKEEIYSRNDTLNKKIINYENDIRHFKNILSNVEMYLVEDNDPYTTTRYLSDVLKPSKKRKYNM